MRFSRPSKYRNKKTEYNGVIYDSKGEAGIAQELDVMLKANEIAGWARQISYPLKVNGSLICMHIVDFCILHNDGDSEVIEFKGMPTRDWRIKKKLFQAVYPKIKYTVRTKARR
jgi:hypothetical protein